MVDRLRHRGYLFPPPCPNCSTPWRKWLGKPNAFIHEAFCWVPKKGPIHLSGPLNAGLAFRRIVFLGVLASIAGFEAEIRSRIAAVLAEYAGAG